MQRSAKVTKSRVINVSCLAATLLGRARQGGKSMTLNGVSSMFPAFNSQELSNALGELLDKQLVAQRGAAGYVLTDIGREGRVGVS
jgi:hypothetical protein